MRKKARRGKDQAYLSGASCWRSSTLLLLRPGAAADLQIASCCCLLQIHTAWLEEKLDPLLCTRRREEEAAAGGALPSVGNLLWRLGKRPWWSGRKTAGRGQITLEVVGPARQNNLFPAWHIRFGPSSKRATKRAERRGKPFWDRSVYNVLSV